MNSPPITNKLRLLTISAKLKSFLAQSKSKIEDGTSDICMLASSRIWIHRSVIIVMVSCVVEDVLSC